MHVSIVTMMLAVVTAGASIETNNFLVRAATDDIAQKTAVAAEAFRSELAREWLGAELPKWETRCVLTVQVREARPSGLTTYERFGAKGYRWEIQVTGTFDRIVDSILPHELSHTILAMRFESRLPRWADEGAAMMAEAEPERERQRVLLRQILKRKQRISLRDLIDLKEYPPEPSDVMVVYGIGHSLAEYLILTGGQEGRARYLRFLVSAEKSGWDQALQKHYGNSSVEELEENWLRWFEEGKLLPNQRKWV